LTGRRDKPLRSDRLVALFLLGVVLFNPPVLRAFGATETLFGWPVLYFYIFVAWAVVIGLTALAVERHRRKEEDR